MAGGGDHAGANKRNREVAGRPKRAKRNKPYEDSTACGGGGAKGKPQPVTAKNKRVAAKEMSESRKPDYNLEKELEVLWGKMRGHVSKEDIIKCHYQSLVSCDICSTSYVHGFLICTG